MTKKNKKISLSRIPSYIFLTAFFCYIVDGLIVWSQLSYIHSFVVFGKLLLYFSVILVSVKIVCTKYSYSRIFLTLILLLFDVIFLKATNYIYRDVFMMILFIIGSQKVEFDRIVKLYVITVLIAMLGLYLLVKLNLVADVTYARGNGYRHSFGFVYPLSSGSYALFSGLSILYLTTDEKFKMHWKNICTILILVILFWVSYKYYEARNVSVILLLSILVSVFPFLVKPFNKKILVFVAVPIIILMNFILPTLYSINYNAFSFLNKALSGRLVLERIALQNYPVKAFGQYIQQVGVAGNSTTVLRNYFYIDSSFYRLLLMYGSFMFFLWVISQMIVLLKIRNKDFLLCMVLILISIYGSFDNSMIILYFNPFMLVLLSDVKKRGKFNKKIIEKNSLIIPYRKGFLPNCVHRDGPH